jgi:hypothetical protein
MLQCRKNQYSVCSISVSVVLGLNLQGSTGELRTVYRRIRMRQRSV